MRESVYFASLFTRKISRLQSLEAGLKEERIHQCWEGTETGSLKKASPMKSMGSDGWHPLVPRLLAGVLARAVHHL